MLSIRSIKSIVKADLIERTRSYSFLVTIAICLLFACVFVPPASAKYAVVMLSDYRGIYNSAWVGATVSMSTITILFLFGFFLVKSAIDRDRQTRVGQIIESTPLNKISYLTGKFLSNFIILLFLVFITFIVSIVMQIIRGEDYSLNYIDLIVPFLVVVIPSMAIVAALAVLFEAIGFLKGGFGNIIYFFIWGALISFSSSQIVNIANFKVNVTSPMGSEIFYDSMIASFKKVLPGIAVEKADGFISLEEPLKTFVWDGVNWTSDIVVGRFFWILIAGVIVTLAALFFKGFDRTLGTNNFSIIDRIKKKFERPDKNQYKIGEMEKYNASKLTPVSFRFSFIGLVLSELKLSLKGLKWWWYVVQAALIVGCIAVDIEEAKSYFGPLSWCWPLLIWSSIGVREMRNFTNQIVFSSPYPVRRQFPATWISGFIITILTGSGLLIKLLMVGDVAVIAAWFIGAAFIPTLAIALGIWTRTSKAFEVVYLVMMFVGIMNNVSVFDFIGIVKGSIESGMPIFYLATTIVLVIVAVIGRKRQIKV